MKKLVLAVALTMSTAALAAPVALPMEPEVSKDERIDINRMLTCGLYHQPVYPSYVDPFLVAANMIHLKAGSGQLDTRYNRYTLMAKVAAAQVESWDIEEYGANLLYCMEDLSETVTKYNLLEYLQQQQQMQ